MARPDDASRSRRGAFRLWAALGLVAGAVLTVWIVRRSGAELDAQALARLWPVLLPVTAWFGLPLLAATESWRMLFPHRLRPGRLHSIRLTWIGLGVNWLLPVATVGGEVVKFRLGRVAEWPERELAASLVADKTLQVATQILYLLVGAGLLLTLTGRAGWHAGGLLWLAGFAAAVALFYRAQHAGLFSGLAAGLARTVPGRRGSGRRARHIDAAIRRVYRRRAALAGAAGLRIAFRLLMAGEILIVAAWLQVPLSAVELLLAAIVLESLAQGARALAFFIPAGLGAQEGALVGAGLLLGMPAETVVIVALVKRAREVLVGGPALLVWQSGEARRLAWTAASQSSSPRPR